MIGVGFGPGPKQGKGQKHESEQAFEDHPFCSHGGDGREQKHGDAQDAGSTSNVGDLGGRLVVKGVEKVAFGLCQIVRFAALATLILAWGMFAARRAQTAQTGGGRGGVTAVTFFAEFRRPMGHLCSVPRTYLADRAGVGKPRAIRWWKKAAGCLRSPPAEATLAFR